MIAGFLVVAGELPFDAAVLDTAIGWFAVPCNAKHVARIAMAERRPANCIEGIDIENLAPDIQIASQFQRLIANCSAGICQPSSEANSMLAPGCKAVEGRCGGPIGKLFRIPSASNWIVE